MMVDILQHLHHYGVNLFFKRLLLFMTRELALCQLQQAIKQIMIDRPFVGQQDVFRLQLSIVLMNVQLLKINFLAKPLVIDYIL